MAMKAPAETLAYVASFDPKRRVPDAITIVDVDPGSSTYSPIVGNVPMPNVGDELHHFGWNACSSDCGTVVNPDTMQAQIQSAIIFGITAALYGEITLKDGRIEQANFDTYQVLRMNEAPAIDGAWSALHPTGLRRPA
jgi:hypothetical protein